MINIVFNLKYNSILIYITYMLYCYYLYILIFYVYSFENEINY